MFFNLGMEENLVNAGEAHQRLLYLNYLHGGLS